MIKFVRNPLRTNTFQLLPISTLISVHTTSINSTSSILGIVSDLHIAPFQNSTTWSDIAFSIRPRTPFPATNQEHTFYQVYLYDPLIWINMLPNPSHPIHQVPPRYKIALNIRVQGLEELGRVMTIFPFRKSDGVVSSLCFTHQLFLFLEYCPSRAPGPPSQSRSVQEKPRRSHPS